MMLGRPLKKAFDTNLDATAFTAKTITATAPTGNGVLLLGNESGQGIVAPWVRLFPYGLGANNDVFSLRITAWHLMNGGPTQLWFPSQIGEFSCTISAFVGLAGGYVLNTERFADTISIVPTVGEPTTTADTTRAGTTLLFSPANDTAAWVAFQTFGANRLQFDIDQTTNTPPANALYQLLDELIF